MYRENKTNRNIVQNSQWSTPPPVDPAAGSQTTQPSRLQIAPRNEWFSGYLAGCPHCYYCPESQSCLILWNRETIQILSRVQLLLTPCTSQQLLLLLLGVMIWIYQLGNVQEADLFSEIMRICLENENDRPVSYDLSSTKLPHWLRTFPHWPSPPPFFPRLLLCY